MRLSLMVLRMEVLEKSAAKGAFRLRTQPQVGHILKALCKCAPGIQTNRIQKGAHNFKRESHILCVQNRSFGKINFSCGGQEEHVFSCNTHSSPNLHTHHCYPVITPIHTHRSLDLYTQRSNLIPQ